MPNELSHCSGQCCERFTISIAPTGQDTIEALRDEKRDIPFQEGVFIADMLIPFQGPPELPYSSPYFTCKHLGPTGCTVYAHRPSLCRRHGVDYKCTHTGCTIKTEPWLLPAETLTRKVVR